MSILFYIALGFGINMIVERPSVRANIAKGWLNLVAFFKKKLAKKQPINDSTEVIK